MKALIAIIVCAACGYGIAQDTVKSLADSISATATALKGK